LQTNCVDAKGTPLNLCFIGVKTSQGSEYSLLFTAYLGPVWVESSCFTSGTEILLREFPLGRFLSAYTNKSKTLGARRQRRTAFSHISILLSHSTFETQATPKATAPYIKM